MDYAFVWRANTVVGNFIIQTTMLSFKSTSPTVRLLFYIVLAWLVLDYHDYDSLLQRFVFSPLMYDALTYLP